jgi:hypothetical protein
MDVNAVVRAMRADIIQARTVVGPIVGVDALGFSRFTAPGARRQPLVFAVAIGEVLGGNLYVASMDDPDPIRARTLCSRIELGVSVRPVGVAIDIDTVGWLGRPTCRKEEDGK